MAKSFWQYQKAIVSFKFGLETDINKTAARAALFLQGQWVLIGSIQRNYYKKLKYGITEPKLTGLVCNIHGFSWLTKTPLFWSTSRSQSNR